MSDPAAHSSFAPVAEAGRIDALDVLRGVATLGILVLNIQAFAMPLAAYYNPTALGPLEGANLYVWVMGRMLADQKFMTIFSMLFGASIVLITERAEARGDVRRVHYRRMGWLLIIGLLHAHLLWSGDILFLYAVCGMLVYPLRRLPTVLLLVLGAVLLAIASAYSVVVGLTLPYWPEEVRSSLMADMWKPTPEMIETELAAYRGGWLDQQPFRSTRAFEFETYVLISWGLWRAGGLMLIGMALFRSGGLQRGALTAILCGPSRGCGRFRTAARGVRHRHRLRSRVAALVALFGCAVQLLAEHRGQPRLCWPSHARVPDETVARLDPSVCSRRTDRPHQLPATDRPLHDSLLRPRSCLVRDRGSRGAGLGGGRRVGSATRRFAALAAVVPLRSCRMGVALGHVRYPPSASPSTKVDPRGV